ncbi:MAG TPA: endo-1,3-alpha-glucanase family glycosylhydrolase [Terriglobales bacterium]|nr:endo-1,3-alpha-glucanase family glycosylhydrolase [Terriglobales bacterium]
MNLTILRISALLTLTLTFFALAGCAGSKRTDLHQTLRQNELRNPEGEPRVVAAYQPWFGRSGHINVGYSSQDRMVLERQVAEAKDLGIAGFVVNWYGPNHPFEDRAYSLLQDVAAGNDFSVAIMYDENADDPGHTTEDSINDLNYAFERYIAGRRSSNAYLRYNGRPVIFIFPKGGHTDWRRVRQAVNSWSEPPLLLYKDIDPRVANDFDGFYAWVHPGRGGWTPDGSNWGQSYLEHFYAEMTGQYPDKLAVGAAWPGFDDRRASWGRNRRMNPRCGKTFADSLRLFRRYYNNQHPLPFLLIVTWNDYEEGTAIERGVAKC